MSIVETLVAVEKEAPLASIIEREGARSVSVSSSEVKMEQAAHANEGEVWSPQLYPYEEWGDRAASASRPLNTYKADEIGLLEWGALAELSEEERENFLAKAQSMVGQADMSAAVVRHGLRGEGAGLEEAFSFRQDLDGYALVKVDLRLIADRIGCDEGLVVTLPAFVDGIPVVRIAAEAFVRRLVKGVSVRLLVIPPTVRRIGTGAFLSLSCEHVHLGRAIESGVDQQCDLAGVTPRLERRSYSVDADNPYFAARDGSLYSKDGTRLHFIAPPYGSEMTLPSEVTSIASMAFCQGATPPRAVYTTGMLGRVESREWDGAVWVLPAEAPVRDSLLRRGVRQGSESLVEHEGCWYDFDDEGAFLVAGPPAPSSASKKFAAAAIAKLKNRGQADSQALSAAGVQDSTSASQDIYAKGQLVLPEEVEGRKLVRIGLGALRNTPDLLIVPATVRIVESDNACLGLKKLVLPESVEAIGDHCFRSRTLEGPVPVPRSVVSVGEGSFEYAVCRLEHTGSIVHVPADQLLSCWKTVAVGEAPFDFDRYDEVLLQKKNIPDRTGAILHRLSDPAGISDSVCSRLVESACAKLPEMQRRVAQIGDCDMVAALLKVGFINKDTFDKQIELLRSMNRTDCVLYLMQQWHGSKEEPKKKARSRFAL